MDEDALLAWMLSEDPVMAALDDPSFAVPTAGRAPADFGRPAPRPHLLALARVVREQSRADAHLCATINSGLSAAAEVLADDSGIPTAWLET